MDTGPIVKLSFIIPLYNRLDLLQPCLASLQATLPAGLDHEILLVDDGSTDGTREWIQSLRPPFHVILNEQNLGYAAANNRAAAAAGGDVLVLLNGDLVLSPGWLQPMLEIIKKTPGAGIVGNLQFRVADGALDHAGFRIDHHCLPVHDNRRFVACLPLLRRKVPAVTGACMVIARSLFLKLRGFDEGFCNGGEDVDLCFRARRLGFTTHVALRSRIQHHVSASPGRRRHDELNSRRLVMRWRSELARLGWLQACRRLFVECCDDRYAVLDCIQTLLFGGGVTCGSSPALPPAEAALREQEDRWLALLGPASPPVFVSSLPGGDDPGVPPPAAG
jgi:GT2 family glycosyltransferase